MLVQPGAQIGRYEVKRTLGRGGMGTVYVAHDPVLGRMVAIKLFSADVDLPDAGQRFAREARSAGALNHPNIVTIFDAGEHDGLDRRGQRGAGRCAPGAGLVDEGAGELLGEQRVAAGLPHNLLDQRGRE